MEFTANLSLPYLEVLIKERWLPTTHGMVTYLQTTEGKLSSIAAGKIDGKYILSSHAYKYSNIVHYMKV